MRIINYSCSQLLNVYNSLKVASASIVYLTGNFGTLGLMHGQTKEELFDMHITALFECIDNKATIVASTFSFYLCKKDKVFDHYKTGPQ